MQKYLLAVAVIGGLVWAKGRYIDPPKPRERSQVEVNAEIFGQIKRKHPNPGQGVAPASDSATISMLNSLAKSIGAEKTPDERARARFEEFMESWKVGGVSESDEAQAAACLWMRGQRALSMDETNDAGTYFDLWRKDKWLYVEKIEYRINGYVPRADHTIAGVTINGTTYAIGIPHTPNPLFWSE
jgi:hypothetical protein